MSNRDPRNQFADIATTAMTRTIRKLSEALAAADRGIDHARQMARDAEDETRELAELLAQPGEKVKNDMFPLFFSRAEPMALTVQEIAKRRMHDIDRLQARINEAALYANDMDITAEERGALRAILDGTPTDQPEGA